MVRMLYCTFCIKLVGGNARRVSWRIEEVKFVHMAKIILSTLRMVDAPQMLENDM